MLQDYRRLHPTSHLDSRNQAIRRPGFNTVCQTPRLVVPHTHINGQPRTSLSRSLPHHAPNTSLPTSVPFHLQLNFPIDPGYLFRSRPTTVLRSRT